MTGGADRPRRTADLRMVPVAVCAWGGAMLVVLLPELSPAVLGAVAVLGAGLVVGATALRRLGGGRARRSRRAGSAGLALVCLTAIGGAAASVALALPARDALHELGGASADAVVVIRSLPHAGADGRQWADADVLRMTSGDRTASMSVPIRVGFDGTALGTALGPGAVVRFSGRTEAAGPGERAVLVLFARRPPELLDRGSPADALAAEVRKAFVARASALPAPGAQLLPGLAVGDTRAVPEALDAAMKASGLSHLTAVSGSNCALVGAAAFGLAAILGGGRRTRILVAAIALCAFVVLVTPEPSVVRAATMSGLGLLGLAIGRPRAGLPLLLLAVCALLVLDPWLALSAGFALSAAATGALILLAPPLARGLARGMPRPIAVGLAVPLSAQIVCGPIIALFAAQQSLVSVPANLLAEPAAPIATVIGLLACLAMPFPAVADLLAACAWLPSAWIAGTAEVTAALPGATATVLPGIPAAVLVALLGMALCGVLVADQGRRAQVLRAVSGLVLALAAGLGGGAAVLTGPAAPLLRPGDWAIAACDVGQGDAVLVRSAGSVMLIDTGPEPEPLRRCLRDLGVERVDILVLTHFDKDHAGAAGALVGRSGAVLHGPPADPGDERTFDDLRRGGATVVAAHEGMRGRLGGAGWEVLWPREDERVLQPGNDVGVVLRIDGGGVPPSVYLADLSAQAQGMLRRRTALHGVAVVKVAHHGSADQDPELYRALAPIVSLISVGTGNSYGHPRRPTLDMLAALGATPLRTDEHGAVLIGMGDDGLRIWTEREHGPDPPRGTEVPPSGENADERPRRSAGVLP